MEKSQNIETKNAFTPFFYYVLRFTSIRHVFALWLQEAYGADMHLPLLPSWS